MRLGVIASLGASAVLGLGALFVAKVALPARGVAQAAVAPAVAEGVPMVVAAQAIKYGERLEAKHLSVVRAPKAAVPEGAFATVEQVLAQDGGGAPIALTAIAAREPLLPAKLSGPGARKSVAAEIEDGMRAYTIAVSDVSGVGGHALPGDHVDVVLMRDLSLDDRQKNLRSEVVLQNVRVLGVDLNADLTSNQPAKPTTATLEVSVQDAQKLAVVSQLGALSLALRGSGQAEIASVAPMAVRESLGGAPRAAAPAAPRASAPAAPRRSGIIIVEGEGQSARAAPSA
jgi:pilus assembly protein CpaB